MKTLIATATLLFASLPAMADGTIQGLGTPPKDDTGWDHQRSWELPAITVEGEKPALREEERVGDYLQPRWTATRRFTTTRAYVVPEGKVEVEVWARSTFRDGETKTRLLQELEIGLPHRFQLDLYLREDSKNTEPNETNLAGQFEVRYALADWGKIWGNPTLYLEYIAKAGEDPDVIEPKLLLSGEWGTGWHWATNFVLEAETGGAREHEWGWTGGVSHTVVDSRFSVGIEGVVHAVDTAAERGHFEWEYMIGPSFQYRPIKPMTINFVPLIGLTSDSPDAQVYFNLGFEF